VRVGFNLPQIGAVTTPQVIAQAAQRAEALGYDGLWTWDRLLYPVNPQTAYPASADGSLPASFKYAWDPLDLLTFAAAHTRRIGLGTSVLNMPYYNPVILARRLTTLDVLSEGRVRVGLGLGWSKDEFDAVGGSLKERGGRADEFLQVLTAIWTTDPVEFHGRYYQVPRSIIGLKTIQKPHPPIYLATYVPAGLERAARFANGWNPVGVPVEGMVQMSAQLREMAKAAGGDPATIEVVVRANLYIMPRPLGADRWIFTGSIEQIKEDIERVRSLGASDLFFDPCFSPDGATADAYLACMERMRKLV